MPNLPNSVLDSALNQYQKQQDDALGQQVAEQAAPIRKALFGGGLPDLTSLLGGLTPEPAQPQQPAAMPTQPAAQQPQPQSGGRQLPDLNDLLSGLSLGPKPEQPSRTDTTVPASEVVAPRPAAPGGTPAPMPTGQPTQQAGGQIDNSSREAFVRTAYPYALRAADGDATLANQLLATAISENGAVGTGRSLGEMGFNVGGIQGVKGSAGSFTALDAGRPREFAAYNDLSEGFRAVRDLISGGRYAQAAATYRQTGDIDRYWREVNQAGYSETPDWQDKIASIRRDQVEPLTSSPAPAPSQPAAPTSAPAQAAVRVAGRYARNQGEVGNELGLPWQRTLEICGPIAAAAFLRKTGRLPGQEEAEAMRVAQEKGYWKAGRGMGGTASEEALLNDLGVATKRVEGAPDWQAVAADVQRGNPVIIDAGDHYMVAEGYDPQTGAFDFGETAGFLRNARGRTSFRPDELAALSGPDMTISPTAAIFLDNPATPTPSVVAGRAPTAGPTPADPLSSPPASGGDLAAAGRGLPPDLTTMASRYGNGQDAYRVALGEPAPMPEDASDAERYVRRLSEPSEPVPSPLRNDVPYDPTTGETGPPSNSAAWYMGDMQRQPLNAPTMGPDTATGDYIDPDQGPRELGYSVPAEPATYGDAGDEPQVPYTPPSTSNDVSPTYGPPLSEAGPEQPSAIGAIENARAGMADQEELAPRENPLKPLYDMGGRIIGYVQAGAQAAVDALPEATRRGVEAGQAAYNDPLTSTMPGLPRAVAVYQAAQGEFGDEVGRRVGEALGLSDEDMALGVSPQDVAGFAGQMLLDPTNLISAGPVKRTAVEAAEAASPVIQRGARSLGSRISGALERNADNVARADARMAREGSTVAPGALGQIPEQFGRPYPDIRRDVRGVVRESLGEPSSEMLADSRFPREAVHPDIRAEGIGPEITPQVDVSSRLNASAGTVPVDVPVDRLGAVNHVLGQGVASAVSGGVGAQVNQQMNPDDPNAAIKGFAVGALAPVALTKGVRVGLRAAGRGADGAEGALATLGEVPNGGRRLGLPGFESIDPLTDPVIPPSTRSAAPQNTMREALPGILRDMNTEPIRVRGTPDQSQRLPGLDTPPGLARRIGSTLAEIAEPWLNRVNVVRYAGMLSDTAGQAMNIGTNALLQGVDVAAAPIAAALDVGRAAATRAPREVFLSETPARLEGMRRGAALGLQAAGDVLRTGLRSEEAAKLEQRAGFNSGNAVVDFAFETPLRALAAADAVFRTMAQGGHLMAEATAAATRANGGKAPTAEMIREAAKDPDLLQRVADLAKRSVLQEDRGLTKWYQDAMAKAPEPLRTVISVEVPFVKTPYNVVAQGMGMTPAGLLGTIQDIKQGKSAREIETRLARVMLGTAVMAGASADYAAGNLTGPYPTDQKERSTLSPGWRPWSRKVTVGDQTYYVPLAYLGPLAVPAVVSILAGESVKKGKTALSLDWAGQVAMGIGQYAEQQTFFEGLSNVAKTFENPDRQMERHLESIAAQFSPHIIGGGALGREIQRVMGMPARDPEGMIEALLATHPATANRVEPAQDVLGRPRSMGAGGPAGTLVRAGVDNDAAVIRAYRKAREGLPTQAPKQINDPSLEKPRTLTPAQQHRWRRVFGAALREEWVGQGNPTDKDSLQDVAATARRVANESILGMR